MSLGTATDRNDLDVLFADNTSGNISAADMRDFVASAFNLLDDTTLAELVTNYTIPQTAVGVSALILKAIASRTAQLLKFQTSAGGSLGNVSGGCFGDVYADVSTTGTAGSFETLRTDTFVANALIANGDKIWFDYTLKTVSHATAERRFKVAFGGITIFDSTALVFGANAGTVRITGYITRKSSTTCRASIKFSPSGSITIVAFASENYVSESTLTGMTLTGTNALVLSAAAGATGAASGDITLVHGNVGVTGFGS